MRWSHSTSNFYALIGQNLTGEFSRKIYGTSAILFPSLQYCWRLGFLKACFFPTLGPLSPSSSPMNSVALASRRCSLWTDVLRRPLCLEGYSTNKAIFFRNQSVNSCIGHFPLESCWWVIWEEEHEKMQCKPSLRWDSHKIYSDVSEGWKWCEPYPPPQTLIASSFVNMGQCVGMDKRGTFPELSHLHGAFGEPNLLSWDQKGTLWSSIEWISRQIDIDQGLLIYLDFGFPQAS